MKEEKIITAKTVEEAMAQAVRDYGSDDKEISYQILEMPKKGFFGIGATPAKILVTVGTDDEFELMRKELKNAVKSTMNAGVDTGESEKPAKEQRPQKPQAKVPSEPKVLADKPQPRADRPAKQSPPKAAAPVKQQPAQTTQPAPANAAANAATNAPANAAAYAASQPTSQPSTPQPRPLPKSTAATQPKQPRQPINPVEQTAPAVVSDTAAADAPKPEGAPRPQNRPKNRPAQNQGAQQRPTAPKKPRDTDGQQRPRKTDDAQFKVTREEIDTALKFLNELLEGMELESRAVHAAGPDCDFDEVIVNASPETGENAESSDGTGAVNDELRRIIITGADSGALIGHHGDTLDALQYLVNLAVNRKESSHRREYVKIIIDVENYRAKREATLRQLARRSAARALKYNRNIPLEPMNPYERRIIHSEIQNVPGVSTHSVGSDDNRRIIISVDRADKTDSPTAYVREDADNTPREQSSRGGRRRKPQSQRSAFVPPEAAEEAFAAAEAYEAKVEAQSNTGDAEAAAVIETVEPAAVPESVKTVEPAAIPKPVKTVEPAAIPEPVKTVEPAAVPEPVKTVEPAAADEDSFAKAAAAAAMAKLKAVEGANKTAAKVTSVDAGAAKTETVKAAPVDIGEDSLSAEDVIAKAFANMKKKDN